MKKLNYYDENDVDFSMLYDSIICEDGAYQNYTKFLEEIGKCQCRRKNPASKERLMNGNLSAFYAFKVKDDFANDLVLKDFINYAFREYYEDVSLKGTTALDETLKLYKSLLTKGNVVQFRLDSPTDYRDENGDYKTIDIKNATNLRTNYYFYILITELIDKGIIEPYTETLTDHLIFSGTDKNIDDLTYATNLSKKGFENVGEDPVDFGFDPKKFTYKSHPLTCVPRIISYVDQEPIRSFESPIPQRQGDVRKKYRYPGTGMLTIFDFMPDDDFKPTAISDISYATRFLFMARAEAEKYWLKHSKYGFDIQYLYSPEEGVYHDVNQGWIDHAVRLAIKYKEYGEPFDLVKVIQFIRATKNENLSYYPVLTFSDYDFGDETAADYYATLRQAYEENSEIVAEIMDSRNLKLHQPPTKAQPNAESSESGAGEQDSSRSGAGQPGDE